MAGAKGRSGGARPGAGGARPNSGGARPGAGRKPNPKPEPATAPGLEPLAFLEGVMQGLIEATPLQVRAAIAAAQYRHMKKGDGGVKDEQADRAKKAAAGKFGAAAPPLKLVGNK